MKNINELKLQLKRASPTILSCLAGVGLVATGIATVKATANATRLIDRERLYRQIDRAHGIHEIFAPKTVSNADIIKLCWRCYIPAAVLGASTLACIFGANTLNKRQQASLASAYMLLEHTYKEFVKKDTNGLVRKEIVKERFEEADISVDSERCLFYEFNHGEFFERNLGEVLAAEYRCNKKFISRGYLTLNDFYEAIDLPKTDVGEVLVWSENDGYPWIDFEHELVELEDGMECYIIHLPEQPLPLY